MIIHASCRSDAEFKIGAQLTCSLSRTDFHWVFLRDAITWKGFEFDVSVNGRLRLLVLILLFQSGSCGQDGNYSMSLAAHALPLLCLLLRMHHKFVAFGDPKEPKHSFCWRVNCITVSLQTIWSASYALEMSLNLDSSPPRSGWCLTLHKSCPLEWS